MGLKHTPKVVLADGAIGVIQGVLLDTGATGLIEKEICDYEITCDNPECGGGTPKKIAWSDAGEVPEDFYPVLVLTLSNDTRQTFCTTSCLTQYLSKYHKVLRKPGNVIPINTSPSFNGS